MQNFFDLLDNNDFVFYGILALILFVAFVLPEVISRRRTR